MSRKLLGIEIGSSRIKIAHVNTSGVAESFIVDDIPVGMVKDRGVVAFEGMSEYLRELRKKHNIKGKDVAFVVPDNAVYIRRIQIPEMTEAQIELNLPYEFRDFITGEKEKYIYDYMICHQGLENNEKPEQTSEEESEDNEGMDILAVAISKNLMTKYQEMFRRAGFKLVKAVPQCFATGDFVNKFLQKEGSDYAVLDLGDDATRVDMFDAGIFDMDRNIEKGCRYIGTAASGILGIDEHLGGIYMMENHENIWENSDILEICNDIALSVMRVVNYYNYQKSDSSIEKMYVHGGGLNFAPLVEAIEDTVPLELIRMGEFADEADREAFIYGPAAIGACVSEDVNLINTENKKDRRKTLLGFGIFVLCFAVFLFAGIVRPMTKIIDQKEKYVALEDNLNQLKTETKDYKKVQDEFYKVSDWFLTDDELAEFDKYEILTMLNEDVIPYANIDNMSINGKDISLELQVKRKDVAVILSELQGDTRNAYVSVDVTGNGNDGYINASFTIEYRGGDKNNA